MPVCRKASATRPTGRRPSGCGADPPSPSPTPRTSAPIPRRCCAGALHIAALEAIARDQEVGPEHLLLGLLRDAEDPVETDLPPQDRRQRAVLGLPDHGPNPIRLLVEARGLTLKALGSAVRSELDRDQ